MSVKRARPMRKPVSRTPVWVAPAAIVAAIAIVIAGFLVVRWYTTPLPPPTPTADATQQVVAEITSLPQSEFDTIGQGAANNLIKPVTGSLLTGSTGKPEVLYVGAEYCPYCAAERWPLIIALGRFGTFSGLQATTSSSTDVYPNTPTFTFRGATYTSQYIDFRAVETKDRNQSPLQSPTAAEQQLVNRYDTSNSIPFVDFANRYAFAGAMYSPDLLGGGTWQSIARDVQNPDTAQAKAIVGSANLITAAICKTTQDQPAAVCSGAAIQSLEQKL
jgi:thiol-disulfide isomerase/thioredoxin